MYINAVLKISIYVRVHIKIMPQKFCIHIKFAKCLFANIQRQQNTLKSRLLFKKNISFTGE